MLLSQPLVQNSCQLSTDWIQIWRPFHSNLIVFSSEADFQLSYPDNWTLSLTNQLLHVTSFNWTADAADNPNQQLLVVRES
jgi:hypothetical protein